MKGTADLYIIYIPFHHKSHMPLWLCSLCLDSHYRITPIAAGQKEPLLQPPKRNADKLTVPSDESAPLLGQNALL